MNKMKYLVLILLYLSCNQDRINNNESIEELIQAIKHQNNYVLNINRDATNYILRTHSNHKETCESNLEKLDQLYSLNNSKNPDFQKLREIVKEYNESVKSDKFIDITLLDKSSKVDYYLSVYKIIEHGNYSIGSVNEPRFLLPYAINKNEFHAFHGDTIKVPIQSFVKRDIIQSRFELVDTLNFTKTDVDKGYFSVKTENMKLGITNKKLIVYGRNIYTNKIEQIGTSVIKCIISEKR